MPRPLIALLVYAGGLASSATAPAVGCRDTHEWVDVGVLEAAEASGTVSVRYPAGDEHPLPEATVIVGRVEPFIEAFVGITNDRGEFAIDGIPDGLWRINVCKEGFKTLEGNLDLNPQQTARELELVTQLDW